MRVDAFGASDIGRSRNLNEDCYAVDEARRVFLVADGMGGHQHGEVASRMAVDAILETLPEGPGEPGATVLADRLADAIRTAHQRVWQATVGDENLAGMGTTVVGLIVDGDAAGIAHVGDSRAYRLRDGELQRLTQDHSWVGEQVAAGLLSSEQARVHPLRNVVTRALGGAAEVAIDVAVWEMREGDLYLLCSDGLTGMLEDSEIERCLGGSEDLESGAHELIRRANDRGGLDNITVLLVAVSA